MHFFNQLFKLAILSDSKGTLEYTVQAAAETCFRTEFESDQIDPFP